MKCNGGSPLSHNDGPSANLPRRSKIIASIRLGVGAVIARRANTLHEHGPKALERRRKVSQRTARENIAQLVDPGSLVEYGSFTTAAPRRRPQLQDLIRNTRQDVLLAGVATINAAHFGPESARCMVLAYEHRLLADARRRMNYEKIGRMLMFAKQWRMPVVFYVGAVGGSQGDTDRLDTTCLDKRSFVQFAKLSGLVPVIGVIFGCPFAGNEAMLRGCDAIIATKKSMDGACQDMFDGGGLGVCAPDTGPVSFEAANGIIDALLEDEMEATRFAQKYLAYFQGALTRWEVADQRLLQRAIPKNRLYVYDVRTIIDVIADQDSVLELQRGFGLSMIIALIRIEGKPFGLVANDPRQVDGAMDSTAANKTSRFLQLCDAFELPIVSLCDGRGLMVKSETSSTAIVNQISRSSVVRANISVPLFGIALRRCYGLGAQLMIGDGLTGPLFTAAWPTSEFGGLGLDDRLRVSRGERDGVETNPGGGERYRKEVGELCFDGGAVSATSLPNIDEVIDPADTRRWIMTGLRSLPGAPHRTSRKHSRTEEP